MEFFILKMHFSLFSAGNNLSLLHTGKDMLVSFAWNPVADNTLIAATGSGNLRLLTSHSKTPLVPCHVEFRPLVYPVFRHGVGVKWSPLLVAMVACVLHTTIHLMLPWR